MSKSAKRPAAFWVSLIPTAVTLIIVVALAVAASGIYAYGIFLVPFVFAAMLLLAANLTINAFLLTPHSRKLTRTIVSLDYLLILVIIWLLFGGI